MMARDYAAEYRARVARGAAEGKRPSDAAGQQKRTASSTRRVPRLSTITQGNRKVQVVQSSDRRFVQQQIRQAAARNKNVQIYAVWATDLGYGTQVAGGNQPEGHAPRQGARAVGKLKVMIGTKESMRKLTGATGEPARRILARFTKRDDQGARLFDDLDDFLADWWDGYEGDYGVSP